MPKANKPKFKLYKQTEFKCPFCGLKVICGYLNQRSEDGMVVHTKPACYEFHSSGGASKYIAKVNKIFKIK